MNPLELRRDMIDINVFTGFLWPLGGQWTVGSQGWSPVKQIITKQTGKITGIYELRL